MGSGAFLVEACRQLANHLVKAYDVHGRPTDVPPDEDIRLHAQRQVAQHCLYGVDKNPFAVDLGKLSLWLATLARDHPFTFLDHSIRHGDSLVGLSCEQIASFHWAPEQQVPVIRAFVDKAIAEAMALRAKIPKLANSDDVHEKRELLRDADHALAKVRLIGDAVVASFFSEEKPRAREGARKRWETKVLAWLSGSGNASAIEGFVEVLRGDERPVPCFHWAIEYPEIFAADRCGFDLFVGNPPFRRSSDSREFVARKVHGLAATCSPGKWRKDRLGCLLLQTSVFAVAFKWMRWIACDEDGRTRGYPSFGASVHSYERWSSILSAPADRVARTRVRNCQRSSREPLSESDAHRT